MAPIRELADVGNAVYKARIEGATPDEIGTAVESGAVSARERLSRGIFIVFSREGPYLQFVEIEDAQGLSIKVGKWIDRRGDYPTLQLTETDCV